MLLVAPVRKLCSFGRTLHHCIATQPLTICVPPQTATDAYVETLQMRKVPSSRCSSALSSAGYLCQFSCWTSSTARVPPLNFTQQTSQEKVSEDHPIYCPVPCRPPDHPQLFLLLQSGPLALLQNFPPWACKLVDPYIHMHGGPVPSIINKFYTILCPRCCVPSTASHACRPCLA